MFKRILLSGAAMAAVAISSSASAQEYSNIADKPPSYDVCEPKPEYMLVGSSETPWRASTETQVYAVNPVLIEQQPIATCGPAVRFEELKCIQIFGGGDVIPDTCDNAAVLGAYSSSHNGRSVKSFKRGFDKHFAAIDIAGVNGVAALPACPGGRYIWKLDEPDTGGICGTQRVPIEARCYDGSVPNGSVVDDQFCNVTEKPTEKSVVVESTNGCTYDYAVSAWELPAASCGEASKTRQVTCQNASGTVVADSLCRDRFSNQSGEGYGGIYTPDGRKHIVNAMPDVCNLGGSEQILEECDFEVIAPGDDENTDYVAMFPRATATFNDARTCGETPGTGDPEYVWSKSTFTPDHARMCGSNTKSGTVSCIRKDNNETVAETLCDAAAKPATTEGFDDVSGCVPSGIAQCVSYTPTEEQKAAASTCLSAVGSGGELASVVSLEGGASAYCVSGASVSNQLCAPTDWNGGNYQSNDARSPSYIATQGQGVCAFSTPSCERVNGPAPVTQIQIGWCGYTSSGGGRYSCGERVNFRGTAPQFSDLCSGRRLAGAETPEQLDGSYQTFPAGKGWSVAPVLASVPGAQCVVHYRLGYSDSANVQWQSVYYDGPAVNSSGGGLFISKKP